MDPATWREIRSSVLAGTVVLIVLFLILLALQMRQLIAVLFLGVVVGIALNPIVDMGRRVHVPRVLAVLLVYISVAAMTSGFLYLAAREFSSVSVSTELDELRAQYDDIQAGTALPERQQVEDAISEIARNAAGGLVNQALGVAEAFFSLLTILFTALMFTITQERMRVIGLSFVEPRKRPAVEAVLDTLAIRLRGFIRAELIAMFVIGAVTYVGLVALGIRLPLLLAFLAFLFEVLPLIGPWLAYLPALAVAAMDGIWAMVAVSFLYLGIQAFENYVVTPLVHGRESQMPAMLIFVALLVGGALMGLIGALVAIPAAVILYILFFEVVMPWNERRLSKSQLLTLEQAALEHEELTAGEPR
jgi:predicted PurR-regulated permease PerM